MRDWPKTQRAAVTGYRNRCTDLGIRAVVSDPTVSPHYPPRSILIQFYSDEDRARFLASMGENPVYHRDRITTWHGVSPRRDLQVLVTANTLDPD